MHRIISKNIEVMTGVCAVCGPVELEKKNRGDGGFSYSCKTARQSQRPKAHKYKSVGQVVRLSDEQRSEILSGFGERCAICGETDDLVLDHCHKTGEWRGVLCRKCNAGVGMFGDDVEHLRAAVRYLSR